MSGRTFCRSWAGSKLFAKVISRRRKSPLARKALTLKNCSKSFNHMSDMEVCYLFLKTITVSAFYEYCILKKKWLHFDEQGERGIGPQTRGGNSWEKVFRIISELFPYYYFHRKSASKFWIGRVIIRFSYLYTVWLKTNGHLNLKFRLFSGHTASFKIWVSKDQDFGNFEHSPILIEIHFCYFSTKNMLWYWTCQKTRLIETALLSIQNTCLNW